MQIRKEQDGTVTLTGLIISKEGKPSSTGKTINHFHGKLKTKEGMTVAVNVYSPIGDASAPALL